MEEINSCIMGREGNGEGDHEAGVRRWVLGLPCLGGSGAVHGGFAVLEAELLLGAGAELGSSAVCWTCSSCASQAWGRALGGCFLLFPWS